MNLQSNISKENVHTKLYTTRKLNKLAYDKITKKNMPYQRYLLNYINQSCVRHYTQHQESVSSARKGAAERLKQQGVDANYVAQIEAGSSGLSLGSLSSTSSDVASNSFDVASSDAESIDNNERYKWLYSYSLKHVCRLKYLTTFAYLFPFPHLTS